MEDIIDYAGLFPPARLSLDTAIQNFIQYHRESDSWMLSRFIIPAPQLQELKAYQEELSARREPFGFSVLGKARETTDGFNEEIESVVQYCLRFHEENGRHIITDVLEIKLPGEAVQANDISMLNELLAETARSVGTSAQLPCYIFYEVVLNESWKKDLETVIRAISNHNKWDAGTHDSYRYAGFKLRCGGEEASMFPSPEQVAYALNNARDHDVPVKCTAGLHHPVRHFNESVQTKVHGFFNVFGGAMLAHVHDLSDEELEEILREEDPEQFMFSEGAFGWNNLTVSTSKIKELRETSYISYGSCNFDEPREDLRDLNLL